jgi:hypothetical protein
VGPTAEAKGRNADPEGTDADPEGAGSHPHGRGKFRVGGMGAPEGKGVRASRPPRRHQPPPRRPFEFPERIVEDPRHPHPQVEGGDAHDRQRSQAEAVLQAHQGEPVPPFRRFSGDGPGAAATPPVIDPNAWGDYLASGRRS